MDCTHDTPGGSRYCALCRNQVLQLHGPRRRPDRHRAPGYRPMPPDFRDMIRTSSATQPALDLETP